MTNTLDEICGNCGLRAGSHHGGHGDYPYNYYPGHEGRMDWPDGPGTTFLPTGTFRTVEQNTPCNQLRDKEDGKEKSSNLASTNNP